MGNPDFTPSTAVKVLLSDAFLTFVRRRHSFPSLPCQVLAAIIAIAEIKRVFCNQFEFR